MYKNISNIYLLCYFVISLFFMEAVVRVAVSAKLFSLGLLISLLYSFSVAIIFFIISSFFQPKINRLLSIIFLGLSGFIFSSQLIYFDSFRTFYNSYSARNATQVFDFWKDILALTMDNLIWVVLLFLPVLFVISFGRKMTSFPKIKNIHRGILVGCIVLTYILGLLTINAGGRSQNSAYDLYFKSSNTILSVDRLGLITTMRLDLQRFISGWSPIIEASPVYLPISTLPGENTDQDKIEAEIIEYNTMDIDFDQLILMEKKEIIKEMHKYFQNVQPTPKNQYTGKYKDYNLILITAESFSPYAVHEDLTPTLYKLVNEGYNFTNFYNPIWDVSTSDGEYVALTSLIPKNGVWSFQESASNYLPFVMGNQLKNLDYRAVAYHNHTYTYYSRNLSHPNMGYDYKGVGNGLNVKEVWPASDFEMLEITIPEYINDQPFHAYYMTVSGHMQYNFFGNNMAAKNQEYVKDLNYSEQSKAYIATQIELDRALEHLLIQLKEANIADKTLIAISADHYPYGLDDESINELAGHPVEKNFELYKSPFILYTQGMEAITIDKPSSSLDIIPTLSNLLGLEYDSRLLMGRDIFADTDPLVLFLNKSFITDKGSYNAITGEFIPNVGEEIDDGYIDLVSSIVNNKFYFSAKILETDYYKSVLTSAK